MCHCIWSGRRGACLWQPNKNQNQVTSQCSTASCSFRALQPWEHLVLCHWLTGKDEGLKEEEEENVQEEEEEQEEESSPGSTLFIKNLNFSTTEETLQEVLRFMATTLRFYMRLLFFVALTWFIFSIQTFSKCGKVKSCSVSKKKDKSGGDQLHYAYST